MPELVKSGEEYTIDITGYSCPYPEVLAREAMSSLEEGETLNVDLDNRPSTETVPETAEELGHEVLEIEHTGDKEWTIRIEIR